MGAALRKMREKRAGEASPFSICPTLKPCHGHSNRQVGTSQQEVLGTGGGFWGSGSVTSHYSEATQRSISDLWAAWPRAEQVMGQKRRRRLSGNEVI